MSNVIQKVQGAFVGASNDIQAFGRYLSGVQYAQGGNGKVPGVANKKKKRGHTVTKTSTPAKTPRYTPKPGRPAYPDIPGQMP